MTIADNDSDTESRGKLKPNSGNGGPAPWGYWYQTLGAFEIFVHVKPGLKSRDVSEENQNYYSVNFLKIHE